MINNRQTSVGGSLFPDTLAFSTSKMVVKTNQSINIMIVNKHDTSLMKVYICNILKHVKNY